MATPPQSAVAPPLSADAFEAAYSEFCNQTGIPFNLVPQTQGLPINLFHTFGIVLAAGGGTVVTSKGRWPVVTNAVLAPRPPPKGMSLHVRHLYEVFLEGFEAYARNTLMRGFSIPPAGIAALQAAEAAMPPPVVRQNSSGSGGASDDQRGQKRPTPDGSPAVGFPADGPGRGRGRAPGRGRGGGRPKQKPAQPPMAIAKNAPQLAAGTNLSARAILPPHGRGRTPKVLPPTLLRRPGAPPAPPGASSPANSSSPAPAGARRDPRAGRGGRGASAAGSAAPGSGTLAQPTAATAAQLLALGFNAPAPAPEPQPAASDNQAAVAPRQRRQRKKKAAGGTEEGDGIKLVTPPADTGTRMATAPAAARSSRARWQMQGFSSSAQSYGNEPLSAMVSWLRDAARQLGHQSPLEPPLLSTMETHTYQEGLNRWRDKEFENLQPPPPPPMPEPGKRRSARARAGTQFFTPTFGGPAKHARDYLEEESEDEDKETREGPGFQAELPPQRPRPARPGPPPDEARWLTGRLLAPGQVKGGPSRPAVDLASLPIEERLEIEGEAVAALRKAVGPHAADLGLDLMGSVIGRDWNDRDAALLEEGMRLVGRDFRRIAVSLLSNRKESELILYYYNVWKTKATPRARAWFTALEQARKAQEAEEAAERARVAEVEARRVAAQVQAVQTRQLRDAVFWLRNSAKWPKESQPRQKVRERSIRMKSLLAAENVDRIGGEGVPMPGSPYSDHG